MEEALPDLAARRRPHPVMGRLVGEHTVERTGPMRHADDMELGRMTNFFVCSLQWKHRRITTTQGTFDGGAGRMVADSFGSSTFPKLSDNAGPAPASTA